jgi:hypothetical protein
MLLFFPRADEELIAMRTSTNFNTNTNSNTEDNVVIGWERIIERLEAGDIHGLTAERVIEAAWEYNEHSWQGREAEPYITPFFNLVRGMKAFPPLACLSAGEACRRWRAVLDRLGIDRTITLGDSLDDEDANDEFQRTWVKVEYPLGTSALSYAHQKSNAEPYEVEHVSQIVGPGYARFLSLAYHLQQIRGDQNVMLPVQIVADVLSKPKKPLNKMAVSRWITLAIQEQLIVRVEEHQFGAGIAAEYRVETNRFRPAKRS